MCVCVRACCAQAVRQQILTLADLHGWCQLEQSPLTSPRTCSYTSHLQINQKKGHFAHFNLSLTISRYWSRSEQCLHSTTLPVDEVFRLCITSWDRRVMADLVSTKERISWASEVTELTLAVTVIATLVINCKISNSMLQNWGVVHTCSATNRKPLSGRSHSYVSPRTGLNGFPPVL